MHFPRGGSGPDLASGPPTPSSQPPCATQVVTVLFTLRPSPQVLLDSLLSLQPRTESGAAGSGGGGGRREDVVMAIATDLLDQVPQPFNLEEVMKAKADDPSALHVVLFQVRNEAGYRNTR